MNLNMGHLADDISFHHAVSRQLSKRQVQSTPAWRLPEPHYKPAGHRTNFNIWWHIPGVLRSQYQFPNPEISDLPSISGMRMITCL